MKNLLKIGIPLALVLVVVAVGLVLINRSQTSIKPSGPSALTDLSVPSFNTDSSGNYTAKNSIFQATLPKQSLGSVVVATAKTISFTPVNAQASAATVNDNQILYANVYNSTDVSYETNKKGLKESIILKSLDNLPKEFSYSFNADDLKGEVQGDSSIVFTQISKEASRDVPVSDGTVLKADKAANYLPEHPQRFKIPAPVMIDAKGNHSKASDVKVTLTKSTLTLTPSQDWLKKAVFPVILDPTVEVAPEIVEEVADKRTSTSKTFLNTDGTFTSVIFQNPIHYKDSQGKYQDIDRSFVESQDPNYQYEVKTGIYTVKLKDTLVNTPNQGDIELVASGSAIGFSPLKLSWSNGNKLGTVQKTKGVISSDKTKITYSSLFGITGIDLQGTYDNEKFLKETVISSKDAIRGSNHTNDNLEISFALALPSDTDLKVNGKVWDGKTPIETQNAIEIYKDGKYISELRKAIVYGSDLQNLNNSQTITVRLSRVNNQLVLTKILPGGFLNSATYPVRTDTTTTFYSSTADGAVAVDDASYAIARSGPATWISDVSVLYIGQLRNSGSGVYECNESFIQFDTSSIGAGNTISAATLSLYGSSDASTVDFTMTAAVYDWGATLALGDYVAGADLAGKTTVATWPTSSGWSTSAYTDFNDVALATNVNKTGATRLILYSNRQSDNIAPTFGNNEYVAAQSADAAGTSQDPKLTVTYASAPTITSPTNTSIHGSDATLGGNVTSDGGDTITGRGVCVGTSANPALGGNCFSTSGTTGVFTVSATSLIQNTLYHYRAYATNSVGTSYTTDDTFTTLALNNYLVTVVSPQTAGVCSTGTNTVTARDSTNTTITTDTSTVDMTNSGTSVTFYTTSGCSSSTTQYTLSSGVANIYYKTNVPQSFTITATKNGSTETGTSSSITVNAGSQTRLVITLQGQIFVPGTGNTGIAISQNAGIQFRIVTITATDDYFNVITGYSGAKTLAYSGPSSSGGTPSYTTSVSFTSGQSTTALLTTLKTAETTTITATDGGSYGYASSSITVSAGGVNFKGGTHFY